jgi:MerR family transcriptional regulator, light-induced transcriptional regulator
MSSRELLTPKQVAVAIGVSESSLKRWCDRGMLPTVRTMGGHRRIPMSGVLKFLQQSGQPVVRPEVLGLPRLDRNTDRTLIQATQELTNALIEAQGEVCRRILFELYLSGHRLSAICDDVIRTTFYDIGNRWECGKVAVYQERTACEITQRVMSELRTAWQNIDPLAPLAIGGTLPGDEYRLPTSACELVLLEAGWNALSLGTNLPFDTWHQALEQRRPKLLWLSLSYVTDRDLLLACYPPLFDHAQQLGIPVVLGGNGIDDDLRHSLRFTTFCENMRQLEAFATSWRASHEGVGNSPSSSDDGDERRLAL